MTTDKLFQTDGLPMTIETANDIRPIQTRTIPAIRMSWYSWIKVCELDPTVSRDDLVMFETDKPCWVIEAFLDAEDGPTLIVTESKEAAIREMNDLMEHA